MIHMHYLFRSAENNLWRVRDGLPGLPTHIELPRACILENRASSVRGLLGS
jgi:hypothetical protein